MIIKLNKEINTLTDAQKKLYRSLARKLKTDRRKLPPMHILMSFQDWKT